MSNAGYDLIREAAADLDRKQRRLREIRAELAGTATKVSSVDNMVSVELDATGELTSVKFNSQKYRRMPPAELGAVLVDTIKRARAQSRDRVISAYQDLMPAGLRELVSGATNLDEMFDQARREADDIVADLRPPASTNSAPAGDRR